MIKINNYIYLFIVFFLFSCGTGEYFGFEKKKIKLKGKRVALLKEDSKIILNSKIISETKLEGKKEVLSWEQSHNGPSHLSINFIAESNFVKFKYITSGSGEKKSSRILSQPLIFNNFIYYLDAAANVIAFNLEKKKNIWKKNIAKKNDNNHNLGGGLAIGNNKLIVNSPYGEILALNLNNGEVLWKKSIDIPIRSAPTISDDKVFSLTVENRLLVHSLGSGELLWEHEGLFNNTTLINSPKIAVDQNIVIVPYSNGDFFGLSLTNGKVIWSNSFIDIEVKETTNVFTDIDANPVIKNDILVLSSSIGKTISVNKKTGNQFWIKNIYSDQTPAINGNSIFIINNNEEIINLDLLNGSTRWVLELSQDLSKNNKNIWLAPVLINDKLIVIGGDKKMLIIDPFKGKIEKITNLPNLPSTSPFVVNSKVYLMFKNGDIAKIE